MHLVLRCGIDNNSMWIFHSYSAQEYSLEEILRKIWYFEFAIACCKFQLECNIFEHIQYFEFDISQRFHFRISPFCWKRQISHWALLMGVRSSDAVLVQKVGSHLRHHQKKNLYLSNPNKPKIEPCHLCENWRGNYVISKYLKTFS